jgi:starch-binding outer membrane protein, SusD/RagB family
MNAYLRRTLPVLLAISASSLTAACSDFLDVKNPNSLEAEGVDPARDRTLLSRSVYQGFVSDYGQQVVDQAWFTNEARVGDTFPTRNEFGRRDIPETGSQSGNWSSMMDDIQFAERTIVQIEEAGNSVDLARVYFTSGYGMVLLSEMFCEVTLAAGPQEPRGPMTWEALLDTAIVRLTKASQIAGGETGTEATDLKWASTVGIARAQLQLGRKSAASATAASVPASFEYDLLHLDDPSNRNRLGNRVFSFSNARISLVVGPEWRAIADGGDPRIAYVDMGRVAQDGVLEFFRQDKIQGWGDPDRLASGLEARYIKVEADGDPTAMLTLINERRAVGNQTPMAATTDMKALMDELMMQRGRDFWLEGHRLADFRRNPDNVPFIIPTGDNYYKPELGLVGNQTCWPVPKSEKDNNPNWN